MRILNEREIQKKSNFIDNINPSQQDTTIATKQKDEIEKT